MLSMPSNLTNALLTSNLTAAVGALRQSRLASTLDQQHEMTVFAPNNDAFEEIGNLIADMTAADLKSVLGYHIVEGKVLYSDMMTNGRVEGTMEGGAVTFRDEEGELFVNGARVVVADMLISNGVVHVIDGYVVSLACCFPHRFSPLGVVVDADQVHVEIESSTRRTRIQNRILRQGHKRLRSVVQVPRGQFRSRRGLRLRRPRRQVGVPRRLSRWGRALLPQGRR